MVPINVRYVCLTLQYYFILFVSCYNNGYLYFMNSIEINILEINYYMYHMPLIVDRFNCHTF